MQSKLLHFGEQTTPHPTRPPQTSHRPPQTSPPQTSQPPTNQPPTKLQHKGQLRAGQITHPRAVTYDVTLPSEPCSVTERSQALSTHMTSSGQHATRSGGWAVHDPKPDTLLGNLYARWRALARLSEEEGALSFVLKDICDFLNQVLVLRGLTSLLLLLRCASGRAGQQAQHRRGGQFRDLGLERGLACLDDK